MLRFIGWGKAADLIMSALMATVKEGIVTYDLARQMEGAREVRCSEFGEAVRKRMLL
jgi:isocitrate dehydrogenase